MPGKIPATVITGFLGAGKTSIIRHLLGHARGRRVAVIVNEFGDVGIDGEILLGCGIEGCDEGNVLELANGCICCTVADDFIPTMKALLERPTPPEHIIIETSGLAMPKPLVSAFNWPAIRTRVTVDAVVTVVDGPALAGGRFAADPEALARQRAGDEALDHESPIEELFEDQLACADLVVVNKADRIPAATLEALSAQLRAEIRPEVKLVAAAHGAVDPRTLLGLGAGAESDLDTRPAHHDGADDHDHDDFSSFTVELGTFPHPGHLVERLGQVIAQHEILRVKGFAAIAGKEMRLLVQAVGARIQHYYDRDWQAEEPRATHLVVIGERGLDEAAVRVALGA